MPIKNIIFDMGNVLLKYDPDFVLEKYCKSDESKKIIKKEFFGGPEWVQGDLGLITPEGRFENVRNRVPEKFHSELSDCSDNWEICLIPVEGAGEFLKEVKEKGYRLFILSNASLEFYHYFPEHYSLDFFDGVVVSADLHMIKPDKRIYEFILEKYALVPEECLFIDDVAENTEGAGRVGINAVQFKNNYDEIRKMLGFKTEKS